ncbi:transcription initiation factor TFIID subunit [Cryptosporidium ryanae]|uniref:transcription initiation factor TFIID subunit n=1 Tax=Cryptosporidium ryanae TaxID=515981 RepID=UPI003519DB6A|nr:transcription initiation factor TFIID subunit [Cryptosporidium ryanae]
MNNNHLVRNSVSLNSHQRHTPVQSQIPLDFTSSESTSYCNQVLNTQNLMKTIIPETQNPSEKGELNISEIFKYLKNNNYMVTVEALLSEINDKRKKSTQSFSKNEEYDIEEYLDEYRRLSIISDKTFSEKYSKFRDWTLNSISLVREELLSVCFVLFVQIYFILLKRKGEGLHKKFFNKFAEDFSFSRYREIVSLLKVSDEIENLKEIDLLKPYIESRFHIILRPLAISLLNSYLLTNEETSIISIIQEKLVIHVNSNDKNKQTLSHEEEDEQLKHSKQIGTFQIGELYTENSLSLEVIPNIQRKKEKKESQNVKDSQKFTDSSLVGRSIGLGQTIYKWGIFPENLIESLPKENEFKKLKGNRLDNEITEEIKGPSEIEFLPITDSSNPFIIEYKKHLFEEVSNRHHIDSSNYPSIITNNLDCNNSNEIIDMNVSHNHVFGAFCTEDGCIQVYNMKNRDKKINPAWIHRNRVQCIRFHPWNSEFILSGGLDSKINLSIITKELSEKSLAQLVTYNGHSSNSCIWDLNWDDYGISFISGSSDRTARLWCTSRTFPIRIFSGHLGDVMSVSIHPNSSIVSTGGSDGQVIFWDVRTGKKEGVIYNSKVIPGIINQVKFGHNGYFLASSAIFGSISKNSSSSELNLPIWDIRKLGANTTQYYQLCKLPEKVTNKNEKVFIKSIDFSYGTRILAAVTNNSIVSLWDTNVETCLEQPLGTSKELDSTSLYKINNSNSKNLKFLPSNLLSVSSVKLGNNT